MGKGMVVCKICDTMSTVLPEIASRRFGDAEGSLPSQAAHRPQKPAKDQTYCHSAGIANSPQQSVLPRQFRNLGIQRRSRHIVRVAQGRKELRKLHSFS